MSKMIINNTHSKIFMDTNEILVDKKKKTIYKGKFHLFCFNIFNYNNRQIFFLIKCVLFVKFLVLLCSVLCAKKICKTFSCGNFL